MKLDLSRLEPTSLRRDAAADAGLPEFDLPEAPQFEIPALEDKDGFLKATLDVLKPQHGTTTLAFIYQHGVVLACDSRATQGPYIASQTVKKVIEINKYLVGTMAGGAADCAFWERNLGRQCRLRELENGRRLSVAAASKLLANTLYSYRSSGLSIGTTICGWDESGPKIFYVDSDGTRAEGLRFAVGSGSTYAFGVLDSEYRFDMSMKEATELARRSIYHATFRDAASGGTASVYHIGPEGWTKISGDDVMLLHDKYYPSYDATPPVIISHAAMEEDAQVA